ncbi:MAG: hypothetical protein KC505_03775 [Myxococcales bacterium]|nr:hypothetical protein [Myxococcales bacterium]USN49971.1 MAG: hypothetical protein H6731_06770 [Myxococcales bacterium]
MQKNKNFIASFFGLALLSSCSNQSIENASKNNSHEIKSEYGADEKIETAPASEADSTEEADNNNQGPDLKPKPGKDKQESFMKKGGIGSQKYGMGQDNKDNRKKSRQLVGFFDLCVNEGTASQQQTIKIAATPTAPLSPLKLPDLSQESLKSIDVLFLVNCDDENKALEFQATVPAIADWINKGGRLVFHDQLKDSAKTALPNLAQLDLSSDIEEIRNIEIATSDTRITKGPRGVLTSESLDGSNLAQGFAYKNTLPQNSKSILTTSDPEHVITFSYCSGLGGVVYSTIPLDMTLAEDTKEEGDSVFDTIKNVYAPNVVAYAAHDKLCL